MVGGKECCADGDRYIVVGGMYRMRRLLTKMSAPSLEILPAEL